MTMFFTATFLTVTVKINNRSISENYEAILTIDDKIACDTLYHALLLLCLHSTSKGGNEKM